MRDYGGVAFFQKLEEVSNVRIEWIHPASGAAGNEQFAIMVASSDLPDMINWPFGDARGGAEALIRDKVLAPISEKDAQAYLPNYLAVMNNNKDFLNSTILDDGTFFQMVNFAYDWDKKEMVEFQTQGPFIRKDWVNKVNKQIPTTVAELYDVLSAIKKTDVNGKGAGTTIPFVVDRGGAGDRSFIALRAMAGLFGTRWGDPHLQNGKVVYGPTTSNYRKYIETMAQWYSEGLINNDFPVLPDSIPMFLNSTAAFTIGAMGAGLSACRIALKQSDPASDLISIPYPKGPDGFSNLVLDVWRNPRATALTSANKYPAQSLKWLDYLFTPQGSIDSTFGILGESYSMVNGKPQLIRDVAYPTSGLTSDESIGRFALSPINFPYVRDVNFYWQITYVEDWQRQIQTDWDKARRDILLPPITLNADDTTRVANIMADIKTYVDEMTVKFIVGQEPLSRYDQFVQNIRNMNIDRAVEIYQTALDRYNANKK
jgi:putative aldouronate transport system substrate-binding protein